MSKLNSKLARAGAGKNTTKLRHANQRLCREIVECQQAESGLKARACQQAVVAKLSQLAFADADLSMLMNEAAVLVAQGLEVEYSKILELLPDGGALLLQAEVGWGSGLVGRMTVGTGTESQAGYTLLSCQPVIVEDLLTETRFGEPLLGHDRRVVSGLSVIIQGQNRPFGVFCAHTTSRRTFNQDDIHFLQAIANVLATAIERQQTEAALRQSEFKFRAIIENSTDAIFLKDRAGHYLLINPAGAKFLGRSSEEILGKRDEELFTPECGRQIWELDQRIINNGTIQTYEESAENGGYKRTFLSTKCPYISPQGELLGLIGICRDISERKQSEMALKKSIEELAKLNRLKDDFLSTVSHELRTPMTNIKMAIQMLKMEPSADRREKYLEILRTECVREEQLINNLLDLQRLEATSDPISLETVNFQDWLPGIIEPFRSRTTYCQQIFRVNLPSNLPPLLSNSASLERILAELLNNACKYTPAAGEINLSIRYDPQLEILSEGATLNSTPVTSFTICNQAEIPAHELPRIFEKFYRLNHTDPWKQGGTGLGLALVRQLVRQLKGTILVESTGGWTTFIVQLPHCDQKDNPLV